MQTANAESTTKVRRAAAEDANAKARIANHGESGPAGNSHAGRGRRCPKTKSFPTAPPPYSTSKLSKPEPRQKGSLKRVDVH